MVESTMMRYPLTVNQLMEHGRKVHPDRKVVTWTGQGTREVSFADTYERMCRLANALEGLGVGRGDVVGTFSFNHQEHVEAYLAIPSMGAVVHQLNVRLFPEQLSFVINDGGARVILVDAIVIPALAQVLGDLETVDTFVVIGEGDTGPLEASGGRVVSYDAIIEDASPTYDWPENDEYAAAAMCYTSGTTGNPKGVVYSHRSIWTHTFGAASGGVGVGPGDRVLVVVPQFHANAWGLIHIAWVMGADILQPGPFLQPEPLTAFIEAARPTCSAAVPSVWNGVLQLGTQKDIDLSSLEWVVVGGSAVPRAMIEDFQERYDIEIVQGWGMTEMSPLGTVAIPPRSAEDDMEASIDYRARTGRIVAGVDLRLVNDAGNEMPWDGKSPGEVQVRGPWITGAYHGVDADEKFTPDGWLRTGDVAVVDPEGFLQIVDRTKDVIKSGGEWISSVDLENEIMAHDAVVEAAVIGVPDEKWDERPLACVVVADGEDLSPAELNGFLEGRVAKWWLPERYTFIDEIPKTSVGKFDKKVLRQRHETGQLDVHRID